MPERICIVPQVHGVGGMVSFLHKFSTAVGKYGVEVTNDLRAGRYAAILVIGGTRALGPLWQARQRGVRVVQRLDGINWIHRVKPISLKHTLRAEYGNLLLSIVRRFLAQRIVYQSEFSRQWWNERFGMLKTPASVVHNGVDLSFYRPLEQIANPAIYRLLVIEGSFGGGYESGLENAVRLAEATARLAAKPVELVVVGEVSPALKAEWQAKSAVSIDWRGLVKRAEIPPLMSQAQALFSADVHPACPNTVIEALACGLPVVAYQTGSLNELVTPEAGFIAPYGSQSWKLEPPIVEPLARGTLAVLENQAHFRAGARQRAEAVFGIEAMTEKYLAALLG